MYRYITATGIKFESPDPNVVARGVDSRFLVPHHFSSTREALEWREEAPAYRAWETVTVDNSEM